MQIDLATLMPFCCDSHNTRFDLAQPFTQGDFTFATDTKISVRIPKIKTNEPKDGRYPPFDKIQWMKEFPLKDTIPFPDWLPALPPIQEELCDACLAEGKDLDGSKCTECGGTGKIQFREQARYRISKTKGEYDLCYLHKIAALSNVRFAEVEHGPKSKDMHVMCFEADGDICGLLMAMTPES